jgi:CRP-like cAMP-binding protein
MGQPITHSLVVALRAVPDFASLTDADLLRIVGASANLFWPAKSLVFEKGASADALYILLSGEVRVFDVVDDEEVDVARISPGDFFGELSLLLHTTHTKSVQAIEDSEIMVLPKASFQSLLASQPALAEQVRRKLEGRLTTYGTEAPGPT